MEHRIKTIEFGEDGKPTRVEFYPPPEEPKVVEVPRYIPLPAPPPSWPYPPWTPNPWRVEPTWVWDDTTAAGSITVDGAVGATTWTLGTDDPAQVLSPFRIGA
jgi:hypothetical protein